MAFAALPICKRLPAAIFGLAGCACAACAPALHSSATTAAATPAARTLHEPEQVKHSVAAYLKALRAAQSLQETQAFRIPGMRAWQDVHNIVNHSPPVLRRRYLRLLKRCAAQQRMQIKTLVAADQERRIEIRMAHTDGSPGCTGVLGLIWQRTHWKIGTERWRPGTAPADTSKTDQKHGSSR